MFSAATTMQAYCTGTGKSARNALKIHRRERKSGLERGKDIAWRREYDGRKVNCVALCTTPKSQRRQKTASISVEGGYGRVKACAASFHSVLGNVRFLVHFIRRDVLIRRVRIENEFKQKEILTSDCDADS